MLSRSHNICSSTKTKDIQIEENVDFASMYLSDEVLLGLNKAGFIRPSPIQLSGIPLARCGLDLIVQAKNGTGKTLVSAVGALEMVSVQSRSVQALIIAPTREIAFQITDVIQTVGRELKGLNVQCFIGGLSVEDDKKNLKGCHIAVGTPGRILQLIDLTALLLNNLKLIVLDEADQLLSSQFEKDIKKLMSIIPSVKQTLALSATYSPETLTLVKSFMKCPVDVKLDEDSPALLGVNQAVIVLPDSCQTHKQHEKKYECLVNLLETIKFNQCLVFSNSLLRAESICNKLKSAGWPATFLTGARQQKERLEAYTDLCSYRCRILVSTDLAARGLDSQHVNLVINVDVSPNPATYLHRVGRAGRFGSYGGAISIVCQGNEFQTLKAVSTLANVNVGFLSEAPQGKIAISKVPFKKHVKRLSEEDIKRWKSKCRTSYLKKQKSNMVPKTNVSNVSGNDSASEEEECTANSSPHNQRQLINESSGLSDANIPKTNHHAKVDHNQEEKYLFLHSCIQDFEEIEISYATSCDKISSNESKSGSLKRSSLLHMLPSSDFLSMLSSSCPGYIDPETQAENIKSQIDKRSSENTEKESIISTQGSSGYSSPGEKDSWESLKRNQLSEITQFSSLVPVEKKKSLEKNYSCSTPVDSLTQASCMNFDLPMHTENANLFAVSGDRKKIKAKPENCRRSPDKIDENTGFGPWVPVEDSNLTNSITRAVPSDPVYINPLSQTPKSPCNVKGTNSGYSYLQNAKCAQLSSTRKKSNVRLRKSKISSDKSGGTKSSDAWNSTEESKAKSLSSGGRTHPIYDDSLFETVNMYNKILGNHDRDRYSPNGNIPMPSTGNKFELDPETFGIYSLYNNRCLPTPNMPHNLRCGNCGNAYHQITNPQTTPGTSHIMESRTFVDPSYKACETMSPWVSVGESKPRNFVGDNTPCYPWYRDSWVQAKDIQYNPTCYSGIADHNTNHPPVTTTHEDVGVTPHSPIASYKYESQRKSAVVSPSPTTSSYERSSSCCDTSDDDLQIEPTALDHQVQTVQKYMAMSMYTESLGKITSDMSKMLSYPHSQYSSI